MVGYYLVAMGNARALVDGVELADSLLDAVTGADAAVIVTEWGEFRHIATRDVRGGDGDAADRRRPKPSHRARCARPGSPTSRSAVRRTLRTCCGSREIGGTPHPRGRPCGRRGHAPSPPAARRPSRCCRSRTGRSSSTRSSTCAPTASIGSCWPAAKPDASGPLRLGARVHRRAGCGTGGAIAYAAPRGRDLRDVRRLQRRRPHRSRPDGARRVSATGGARMTIALAPGGRPEPVRGRRHRCRRRPSPRSIEKPPPGRRRCGRSTRAPTSSSRTCST